MKAARQTIASTILSYVGVVVGAFYTIFIIPQIFDKSSENYGALVSLLNYVGIFIVFTSFSASYTILKFYPVSEKKERTRILSFLLRINLIGILLGSIIFYSYSKYHPIWVSIDGVQKDISIFFYPLLCANTLFSFFQAYCTTQMEIAIPTFLNNTFAKLWMFGAWLLLLFNIINFNLFIYLYYGQFVFIFMLLIVFVLKKSKDNFSLKSKLPNNYKQILIYSLSIFFSGASATLITKVDIRMIDKYIGISEVGFYNNAIFFMSVLLIPKNMLMLTSRSIISRDFYKQERKLFIEKYKKISFAFLISTLAIFIGIFININELMLILGDKFGSQQIKFVIIILGIARILESLFMLSTPIIEYSKYYLWAFIFDTTALFLVIILNLLFIPQLGLIGVALASAVVYIAIASCKSIFVYNKFKIEPFRKKDLLPILIVSSLAVLYLFKFDFLQNQLKELPLAYSQTIIITVRSCIYTLFLFLIIEKIGIRKEFWKINKNDD